MTDYRNNQCNTHGCGQFYWHDPPTPVNNIPLDVQLKHTIKLSIYALRKIVALQTTNVVAPTRTVHNSLRYALAAVRLHHL
jgi:hypothetical protein